MRYGYIRRGILIALAVVIDTSADLVRIEAITRSSSQAAANSLSQENALMCPSRRNKRSKKNEQQDK